MVASFAGVQYGKLFYRACDNHKSSALKATIGNYSASTRLPPECIKDLHWWIQHIEIEKKNIIVPKPSLTIATDASKLG